MITISSFLQKKNIFWSDQSPHKLQDFYCFIKQPCDVSHIYVFQKITNKHLAPQKAVGNTVVSNYSVLICVILVGAKKNKTISDI